MSTLAIVEHLDVVEDVLAVLVRAFAASFFWRVAPLERLWRRIRG